MVSAHRFILPAGRVWVAGGGKGVAVQRLLAQVCS